MLKGYIARESLGILVQILNLGDRLSVLPLCCNEKVLDFMIKKTLDSHKKH